MPTRLLTLSAALCMVGCQPSPGSPAAPAAPATARPTADTAARDAEAEVRARERAWLDAYDHHDPVAMDDILADGFLITSPNGSRGTRSELVAAMQRPRPPGPRSHLATRGTLALVRDATVVLTGEVVESREDPSGPGREIASWYTDTWVREGSRWRVLSSQLSHACPPAPSAANAAP